MVHDKPSDYPSTEANHAFDIAEAVDSRRPYDKFVRALDVGDAQQSGCFWNIINNKQCGKHRRITSELIACSGRPDSRAHAYQRASVARSVVFSGIWNKQAWTHHL